MHIFGKPPILMLATDAKMFETLYLQAFCPLSHTHM